MTRSLSKSDLARDNTRLRRRIEELKTEHTIQIGAKNRAIESLQHGNLIFELGQTFPHFADLIAWLRSAHLAASALRSPTGDGRSHTTPTPLETGAPTRADRSRADWIDRQLANLATQISQRLEPRGPLDEKGPQCWEPDCPARGWHQGIDTETCISCGRTFGRYRPLNDLTHLDRSHRRCWTRGCPQYSKTGQCEHSTPDLATSA